MRFIQWLLTRDSVLVAKADEIAAAAEAIDPELTTEMYDAEDAKRAACETIYQSIWKLPAARVEVWKSRLAFWPPGFVTCSSPLAESNA